MLRKRKSQHKVADSASVRPSLSLPDITSPLLDTSTWGWYEVPPLVASGMVHATPSQSERHRAPSLVRDPNSPSPVQFHRPFTPWQVVDTAPKVKQATGSSIAGRGGDFRDTAKWRTSGAGGQMTTVRKRARGRGKALDCLNVVVAGGRAVGKTSFLDLLAKSLETEVSQPSSRSKTGIPLNREAAGDRHPARGSDSCPLDTTPASPTSPGPPVSTILNSIGELAENPGSRLSGPGPTLRLSSRIMTASLENHDTVQLRIIDTPGLNLTDDPVAIKARERGVAGLLRLLEERFENTLKEETRIDRSRKRLENGMIHLVLYLIDARAVLCPLEASTADEDVDWSCVGLFDQDPILTSVSSQTRSPEPRLDITEIAVIRRLSKRANVLPILSHTDSLTINEIQKVREIVRQDLAKVFDRDEGAGFGILGIHDNDEPMTGSPGRSTISESDDDQPLTPVSLQGKAAGISDMPYTIFSPEHVSLTSNGLVRQYTWGTANLVDPRQSDFMALRSVILGEHASTLRLHTKEKLYETYRTERLLAKRGGK